MPIETIGPSPRCLRKRLHVLDILVEHILVDIAARGTTLAAMVEEHELHSLGERRERRLHATVIGAWATMDDEGDRLLAHRRAIGNKAGTNDVKIDFGVADLCAHDGSQVVPAAS